LVEKKEVEMDGQELIWVDEDFAKKYKELKSDAGQRKEQIEALNGYIQTVTKESKEEFRSNLDCLDEDVAIYKGLMINVKQAFEKAKNEQLSASYELWERFDKEIPFVENKINSLIKSLDPLVKQLEKVNSLMGKIQTWNIDTVFESIRKISELYGKNKEMVQFLMENFKTEERTDA